jgi:hypothetical protein
MILELTLMLVSAAVMTAVLVHKHLEDSRGLKTRVEGVRQKTDPFLYVVHEASGRFFSYITLKNAVIFLNHVFVLIVRLFMHVFGKAHEVSSNIVEKASKKTEDLTRGGSASFYLKKIKEGKEEGQQGTTESK